MVAVKKKTVVKKNQVLPPSTQKQKVVKKLTGYYAQIRSRHPSHNVFRGKAALKMPFRSVIRFGSTTELDDNRIEINSTESIKNSASKLRMKNCFTEAGVKTADWFTVEKIGGGYQFISMTNKNLNIDIATLPYPIVAKHHFGSRGNGNYLLNSQQELQAWMKGKDLSNYLFEKFYNYVREYRVHVSANGCFYTCRKMLKSDIPKEDRWFRNDSNSVWILEENPLFDRPANWTKIVEESVKALNATGLDVGACDVRVQSAKDSKGNKRKEVDFIIIEINSAPSMGERTEIEYLKELPKLLKDKFVNK